jgi:hypothetical protein
MNAQAYRRQAANHTAAASAREEAAARAGSRGDTVKANLHTYEAVRHTCAAAECLLQAERLERQTRTAYADGLANRYQRTA